MLNVHRFPLCAAHVSVCMSRRSMKCRIVQLIRCHVLNIFIVSNEYEAANWPNVDVSLEENVKILNLTHISRCQLQFQPSYDNQLTCSSAAIHNNPPTFILHVYSSVIFIRKVRPRSSKFQHFFFIIISIVISLLRASRNSHPFHPLRGLRVRLKKVCIPRRKESKWEVEVKWNDMTLHDDSSRRSLLWLLHASPEGEIKK